MTTHTLTCIVLFSATFNKLTICLFLILCFCLSHIMTNELNNHLKSRNMKKKKRIEYALSDKIISFYETHLWACEYIKKKWQNSRCLCLYLCLSVGYIYVIYFPIHELLSLFKWNDSVRVEPGHVKYRLKSVKPPDFPNHRQHTQTEDEVECHSYGPDFSPHYHQKRTGGNDAQLHKTCQWQKPIWLLAYVRAHHKLGPCTG